jgi:anti-anti-sigma factor
MAELTFQTFNQWTIARFRTRTLADSQLIARASAELDERIATLPLRAMLLINFKGVEFVSSQVIGLLLNAQNKIAAKSGTLKLCHVTPKIREALHITGLLDQFTIAKSESAVVGRVKRVKTPLKPAEVGWVH